MRDSSRCLAGPVPAEKLTEGVSRRCAPVVRCGRRPSYPPLLDLSTAPTHRSGPFGRGSVGEQEEGQHQASACPTPP